MRSAGGVAVADSGRGVLDVHGACPQRALMDGWRWGRVALLRDTVADKGQDGGTAGR